MFRQEMARGPLGHNCTADDDCKACTLWCVESQCECIWYYAAVGSWCTAPTGESAWSYAAHSISAIILGWTVARSTALVYNRRHKMRFENWAAVFAGASATLLLINEALEICYALGLLVVPRTPRGLIYYLIVGVGLALGVIAFLVISLRWLEHASVLVQALRTINTARQLILCWLAMFCMTLAALIIVYPMDYVAVHGVWTGVVLISAIMIALTFLLGATKLSAVLATSAALQMHAPLADPEQLADQLQASKR
jgi:hypothetical protein